MSFLHLLTGLVLAGCLAIPAQAAPELPRNGAGGLAIRGYDAVAYFTDGRPEKGRPEYTFEWDGATWRFLTAAHRDAFAAEPERYAPQYGGYCAWAVSQGYTADADPLAWAVVDGRLFLNYNAKVQERWAKDRAGRIAAADAKWPELQRKP